jgi:RNA polymerase sigma-B factor
VSTVENADVNTTATFSPTKEPETRYGEFDRLFKQWRESGDPALRDRLILMNRNLVAFIARKFLDRGEMSEDLMQQGLIGLINALDNFDPARGTRFATFASPTIMGEIRRYLRDKTWTMRVPRRLQELHVVINQRIESLTQQLDRSPTYVEIARSLNIEVEEVIEALEMPFVMDPVSIDDTLPTARGDSAATVGDQIGTEDSDLESWNDHAILQTALEKLPQRERQVLQMVYFQEQTQLEVANQLKISQMNVSRIQRRALAHLRELMNSDDV